ncbi:MAG TPA: amino acid permease [Pyrinomonadaceae bacterium]|nr:amino acid permease [Pyrinomonadaceae bacterium]
MSDEGGLRRQIGLRTATALVVGETIAVGIFLTPAEMAKSLGSPALVLAVWLVMGAMALCGALCYGELAARFPEAGGGYVYLREAYGRPVAFLYGWMALLVMDPGITAALAVGLGGYAAYLFGLGGAWPKVIGVGAIVLVAAANVRGVSFGAGLVRWLTVLKLGLLLLIPLWGFGLALGDWSNFTPLVAQREGSAPLVGALAGALVVAFFSFGGWWDLNKLAGEVREPSKTLPRALAYGVLVVTLVYILTSAVFVYLVPIERVASGETFAAQAGEVLFGRAGGQVFAAIVVVAVGGSLAGLMLAAPRVYFAMARDRLFPEAAARLHPKTGTPARAVVVQAALASLLVALGTFREIVAYFIFSVVVFIALTVVALFVLRRRERAVDERRADENGVTRRATDGVVYRTPGYPLTPAFFLLLTALMLVLLGAGSPRQSLLGVAVVASGLPFYYLVFRRGRAARAPSAGEEHTTS